MNNQNNFLRTKLKLILFLLIAFIFVDIPLQLYTEAYTLVGHGIVYGILLFLPYSRKLKNYLLHIYMVFIVLTFCIIQGGISSPVIYFFLSPIMSAHLSFGSKIGKIFTFSVLILIALLFLGDIFLLNPFSPLDTSAVNIQIFTFAIIIGVGLDVIVTIINYDNIRNEAELVLREKQNEILQQEEELKQQQEEIIAIQEHEITLEKRKKEQYESDKIKAENNLESIKNSIEYAAKIQLNTLPSDKVLKDFFTEYYIYYKPKEAVGGDYYYVSQIMGTTIIALIDCYNKGLTGMLLGTVIISYLDTLHILPTRPSELIYELHQYIRENFNQYTHEGDRGCNLSIIYIEDQHIVYSGANGIGYIVKEGDLIKLKSSDRSIGNIVNIDSSVPYMDKEYDISSDDVIVLSTDGFINQKDLNGKPIGEREFEGIINSFYNGYSKSWEERFDEYIKNNFSEEQEDDISILCFNLV